MDKKIVIGVIGSDAGEMVPVIPPTVLATAEEVGRLIVKQGGILLTGGKGGVMEAASRGANLAGGVVVGILPGFSKVEANPYVTVPLAMGLAEARNALVVRAVDAVIMICGSQETFQQATIAYGRKPLIVMEGTGGWADRMRQTLYEGRHFDERRSGDVVYVTASQDAVSKAFELAETFRPKEGLTISAISAAKLPDPS